MFPGITTTIKNIVSPFKLQDIPGFLLNEYFLNLERYQELEMWFSGAALSETQLQGSKKVDVYPIKLNPIYGACLKHAYALFGEFPDDSGGTLVTPKVVITDEDQREQADIVEDALSEIYYQNNFAASMMENGIVSQVYGGAIFKVSWVPDSEIPIKLERILPKEFVAVPFSNDPWRLRKAWVIRQITAETALEYGVSVASEYAYYIEIWTPTDYQILINDNPIAIEVFEGVHIYGGINPFGFVPFVYIPHQRSSNFYGETLIRDAIKGIITELNLRFADAGDATSDDSHSLLAMRNVRGTPQMIKIANAVSVINLGSNNTVTGQADQPDLFAVRRTSLSEAMIKLNSELHNEFRREVMVPAVADGEDEGSQRSAMTLNARMWPLVSHVKSERVFWSTGLTVLNRMILKICEAKGLYNITSDHLKLRLKNKWYPILPRDRQALVEEAVARIGVNLGSVEQLLEMLGDVDDEDLVISQIKEWLNFQAELQAKANPYNQMGGGPSSPGDTAKKTSPPAKKVGA